MCVDCDGLGRCFSFVSEFLISDPHLNFFEGGIPIIRPLRGLRRWRQHTYEGIARTLDIDLKTPWKELPAQHRDWLLNGAGDRHITFEWRMRGGGVWKHGAKWEGIIPQLITSFKKTAAGPRRLQLEKYMRVLRCPDCQGQRLNPQARAVRVGGKTLVDLCALPVGDLVAWLDPETGSLEKSFTPIERTI